MQYSGLSETEAKQRLKEFGPNSITRRSGVIWWKILISQFRSPLIYILVLAALITVFLAEYQDALVISLVVVINTLLGFVQEYRAGKSLEALASLLVPRAKVKRDGVWQELELSRVVPGDLVRLEIGQSIPADGLLIVENGMFVNEALLTGESVSVEKKPTKLDDWASLVGRDRSWFEKVELEHKCFMGTTIETGIGELLVVKTGGETRLGSIAKSVAEREDEETPLQLKLRQLSRRLAFFVVIVALAIFFGGLALGDQLVDIFPAAVALAVAAIPEGLLVSLTLILSIGMNRIWKRGGLVRNLLAAETLGGVDVICLDKTGTLTEGRMSVEGIMVSPSAPIDGNFQNGKGEIKYKLALLGTLLCNDLSDPLEIAMVNWAKGKPDATKLAGEYKRLDSIPFSHKNRYITTRHQNLKTGKVIDFLSGAPETCLEHSTLDSAQKKRWKEKIMALGQQGYRLIGIAYRTGKPKGKIDENKLKGFEWLGLVAFVDPVRVGVSRSLKRAQEAGISLKVITGDYQETAWAVLVKLGMAEGKLDPNVVVTGNELENFVRQQNDEQIGQHIKKAILFARVTPEQKLAIVEVLQRNGHVVAMTGDGVNDAPAIRVADIGMVVGESSDVAKETADLVLLDNNFDTILAAVEEGRLIYTNIRKVILYLMADAFAAIVLVVGTLIFRWPLPLLAVQILWINLISDGFPYLALAFEQSSSNLLKQKPTPKTAPLLDRTVLLLIILVSGLAGGICLFVFRHYYFTLGLSLEYARTVVFATLGTMTLVYVYSVRSLTTNIWQENPLKNIWLVLGTLAGLGIQLAALYLPSLQQVFGTQNLAFQDWLVVIAATLVLMISVELVKFFGRRFD